MCIRLQLFGQSVLIEVHLDIQLRIVQHFLTMLTSAMGMCKEIYKNCQLYLIYNIHCLTKDNLKYLTNRLCDQG